MGPWSLDHGTTGRRPQPPNPWRRRRWGQETVANYLYAHCGKPEQAALHQSVVGRIPHGFHDTAGGMPVDSLQVSPLWVELILPAMGRTVSVQTMTTKEMEDSG